MTRRRMRRESGQWRSEWTMWSRGVQYARRRAGRLLADEHGQDLIEYALLTAAIGLCALAAFSLWGGSINGTYKTLNTTTNGLWDPELKK